MQSNTDTTQNCHGVFQNEVVPNIDTDTNQNYHGVFQNEVMPNNSSINNLSNIRPHESTQDTQNDRIIDDNLQSKTDQFNDLQSLIMSNDISPEELQKKLDEIYYANTVGVRQNNQNQTAQIKKTYGKD